jgi:hypothetical protein
MWKDLCEKNAKEVSDPYIKTIFSLISTGNWKKVLKESTLPMADNLGIALRYLNDNEVSGAESNVFSCSITLLIWRMLKLKKEKYKDFC